MLNNAGQKTIRFQSNSCLSERALREVYLPVRYGERPATREDVARAKAAYEQMRKG